MLAANAVALALTFTSRVERVIRGDGGQEKDTGERARRWAKAQEEVLFAAQKSGKLVAGLLDRSLEMGERKGSWEDLAKQDARAREDLKVAITRAGPRLGEADRQALIEWGDKLTPIEALELPEGLLDEWTGFGQERLQKEDYVMRCKEQPSDGLPLARAQVAPPSVFRPQATEDLFEAWAWKVLQAWIAKQLEFLADIRKRGLSAVRRSNETLALGQGALVPSARGIWWDCRGSKPVPLNVEHVEDSHINFEVLVEEGELWGVDHELTDMFRFGFSYKADLELQVVGCPHLVSLRENYERLVEDTRKMTLGAETSKFFEIGDGVQFVPCRFGSKGSAKKDGYYLDGTPKRRPTNEGGAPRRPTNDTDGVPVRPINVATEETAPHLKGARYPKWAHEGKPRLGDFMKAIAILKHLAQQEGRDEAVYEFGDDCASFFNQFRTRTEQWPTTTFLIDDEEGKAQFVTEKGMTFGPSKASQLAQRIANFVIDMFYRRLDAADEPFAEEEARERPAREAWLKARGTEVDGERQWTTQCRLYAALMYTDDPAFVCLGADRLVRMLVVWERLTRELRLIMNKEKRSVGTHMVWLGFGILTTPGMLYLTKKKVVKLTLQIAAAVEGRLTLGDYRSMMGSLEHIVFATNRDRAQMFGLWRPLQGAWEPNNQVRLDVGQKEQLRWWMKFIAGVGGVSALRAVTETLEQRVEEATQGVLTVTSDAYSEPGGQGLGVYMHGLYAWYDVPRHLQGLHITTLEFLAGLFAIKTCAAVVEAAKGQLVLHMRLDAITACYALTRKSERSEMLQAVHQVLLKMPEFMAIKRWVVVSHIAGLSNVFADMASRPGKRHLMFELAAVMGVELSRAETPVGWLESVVEELLTLKEKIRNERDLDRVRSPVKVPPQGQHADTPHFAALGEKEGNDKTKASFRTQRAGEERQRQSRGKEKGVDPPTRVVVPDEHEQSDYLAALGEEVSNNGNKASRVKRTAEAKKEDEKRRARVAAAGNGGGRSQGSAAGSRQKMKGQQRGVEVEEEESPREFHLTDRMVSVLRKDTSQYAIAKTSRMREAIRVSHDMRMFGKNESTQRQQKGQWRLWVGFCEAQGICPTRDDHDANAGRDRIGFMREVELLNSALCFYMGIAKGRGRSAALPKAGMNWLRGIRRVHEQMMPKVEMVPMKTVQECFDGLMRQYQLRWTVAATLPVRKEPLTNSDITRLIDLWWDPANDGKRVGRFVVKTGSALTITIGCLWLLLLDSGMRLAELTSDKWDMTRCSRASVAFRIRGVLHRSPSRLQLMGMREGDFAIVTPPPSKKDPHGVIWGCKPIWLDFREDRQCTARALRDLELAHPIDEAERASSPLFVDEARRCVKGSFVRRLFRDSLRTFKSPKDARKISTHSFRITLGCKLKAAGCSDSVIMALCRWQSLKSLEVYCRLTPGEYTRFLKEARKADARSIQITSLPDLGEQLDEGPQEEGGDAEESDKDLSEEEEEEGVREEL